MERLTKMLSKRKRGKAGFTLVELMIVVIIVGILAAVAVPMYTAHVKKAIASEGLAIAGSVRTSQRVYYAEHDEYAAKANIDQLVTAADFVDNKYFQTVDCVDITGGGADSTAFTVIVTGTAGTDAAGIVVTMKETGEYKVEDTSGATTVIIMKSKGWT